MSGVARSFRKGSETIATWFGISKDSSGRLIGRYPGYGTDKAAAPDTTGVPTTDTSANLMSQEDQMRNRQRGVLANIYAGNNAGTPALGTKQLLGS